MITILATTHFKLEDKTMTGLQILCVSSKILNECGYLSQNTCIGEDNVTLSSYRESYQQKVTVHIQESNVLIFVDKDKPFNALEIMESDWQRYLKDPTEAEIKDALFMACYLTEEKYV